MRSHHAPTKHLLERFTYRDRSTRKGRAIWVYEKGERPRSSKDLSSESAEHGYFAGGSTGETELEIERRLNQQYEIPFNELLVRIDSGLPIFDSSEVRQVCSRFVAHLFHRTMSRRQGTEQLMDEMLAKYTSVANDPKKLRTYAGKLSLILQRPVQIDGVKAALIKNSVYYSTEAAKRTYYVNDLDRSFHVLASELIDLSWSVVRAGTPTNFFVSDTPVVSVAVDCFGEVKFGVGIRQPTAAWYLPLSPRRILRVGHHPPRSVDANEIEIANLNEAQILTMHRRLYGRNLCTWTDFAVQRDGGKYKFHEHVFKGTTVEGQEDEFDDLMML